MFNDTIEFGELANRFSIGWRNGDIVMRAKGYSVTIPAAMRDDIVRQLTIWCAKHGRETLEAGGDSWKPT